MGRYPPVANTRRARLLPVVRCLTGRLQNQLTTSNPQPTTTHRLHRPGLRFQLSGFRAGARLTEQTFQHRVGDKPMKTLPRLLVVLSAMAGTALFAQSEQPPPVI